MELLLGIDIGTSACKVAVFQRDGTIVAGGSKEYPVYYPGEGFAEQAPEDWWNAVCEVTRFVIEKGGISSADITGVGIDGQGWAAVAVDKDGAVLANTPIWIDTRAGSICERLKEKYGSDRFFEVSGNSLQSFYTTGKVLWYKENKPEVYEKTAKILQSNSFIGYRLTGVFSQDISQCYGYHFFDMRKGTWDHELRRALGISEGFLPDIVPCHHIIGKITKEAAGRTGLAEGTPVAAGGLDAACGTLGGGVIHAGETQEQGGQAGGMSICIDEYAADPKLILSYHVVPDKWLLQGGTTGGGGVMRWFEQEFGDFERKMAGETGNSSLNQLNAIAEKVPAGSDGLVFLPYMAGERSPIWNDKAKGVYFGMDFGKTKGHFVRAAMEGVAYSLKHNLDTAEESGVKAGVLRAMGGAANSLLWTQMKADITGKPIIVPSSDTATTLGAAMLAGVGTGVYTDFEEAVKCTVKITRRHNPQPVIQQAYNKNFEIYKKLYKELENLMVEAGGDRE